MSRSLMLLGLLLTAPSLAGAAASSSGEAGRLLDRHCLTCHGAALQQSGLRLDRREDALRGGRSGPAIRPGDASASELMRRLEGREGVQRMPPGAPLLPAEIAVFRRWIEDGAPWRSPSEAAGSLPEHWSLRPNRRPQVPAVRNPDWVRNPVDSFVLAKLEQEGLHPSPEAPRHALVRRAHLDIVGLPPEPGSAASKASHEEMVDLLLDSQHFGERWAAPWLDQVRYADSDGYEKDTVRPHAWRYRHWVIEALNRDMPFNQFTVEQIAGDLLPGATARQLIATGFYRNTLKNREGGVNVEQYRFEEVVDRTNTVATVWLGLSLECARCHDHKYDPLTQRDYYRFFAFFNELEEVNIDAPLPGETGPFLAEQPTLVRQLEEVYDRYDVRNLQQEWRRKMLWAAENPGVEHEWDTSWDILDLYLDHGQRILRTPREERGWREDLQLTEWFLRNYSRVVTPQDYEATGFSKAVQEMHGLVADFPDVSRARTVRRAAVPPATHIHPSGAWDDLGERLRPGAPAALPPAGTDGGTPDRLGLARWLASEANPLTARVAVNRIWQGYFGAGLVATPENFGLRGDPPSHPDLLDWLAAEFIDSGWSRKHIHRLIATSATYRQSSGMRDGLRDLDPANRLLARQSRLRLPAESLRDSALAVSGLLDPRVGGRSVRPGQPPGVADLGYGNTVRWEESDGRDRYRRGVYIHFQRTTPYPLLANFDLDQRSVTQCARGRSTTPLQALNLLNDPVFFEAAQGLAYRVLAETAGLPFQDRLKHVFRLCLSRAPSEAESEALRRYYVRQQALLEVDAEASRAWLPLVPADGGRTSPAARAAWVGISRILLNTDEFVTRE